MTLSPEIPFITSSGTASSLEQVHNLQGQVQNENEELLVKNNNFKITKAEH